MKRLVRKFYVRPALKVAKDLLGKYIVRRMGNLKIVGKIVETEAYVGPRDRASHAYLPASLRKKYPQGKITKRNEAEYLIGGHIYIYLVYGMHWQFNIVTGKRGAPECVLIRAIEPVVFSKLKISDKGGFIISKKNSKLKNLTNGPGKLCRYLKLDKSFYGEYLAKSKRIWLEHGEKINTNSIKSGPRIGIDYAGKYWAKKPWRFWI